MFTIFAPPLRERKPDIMLLADHFLEKYSREHGKHIKRISTPAIDMLTSYHWPGNVRELENTIERAVLVCDGGVIHAHHLPPTLQTAEASDTVPRVSLAETVEAFERDLIQDALEIHARQPRAARRGCSIRPNGSSDYKIRKYASTAAASAASRRTLRRRLRRVRTRQSCQAIEVRHDIFVPIVAHAEPCARPARLRRANSARFSTGQATFERPAHVVRARARSVACRSHDVCRSQSLGDPAATGRAGGTARKRKEDRNEDERA